jgi:predicted RND superfamily exporter protein
MLVRLWGPVRGRHQPTRPPRPIKQVLSGERVLRPPSGTTISRNQIIIIIMLVVVVVAMLIALFRCVCACACVICSLTELPTRNNV